MHFVNGSILCNSHFQNKRRCYNIKQRNQNSYKKTQINLYDMVRIRLSSIQKSNLIRQYSDMLS